MNNQTPEEFYAQVASDWAAHLATWTPTVSEFCVVSDQGVIASGFKTLQAAKEMKAFFEANPAQEAWAVRAKYWEENGNYHGENCLMIDDRANYDDAGQHWDTK
tara:strand:- start:898 stop:1209 length:312 start_codon:yes stop_codon:yes gene_type:complete